MTFFHVCMYKLCLAEMLRTKPEMYVLKEMPTWWKKSLEI